MRKLGPKNRKLFILLSIITLFVIIIFVYFIRYMVLKDNEIYTIAAGNYLYDSDYNMISVEKDSTLSKKFDNNYYLTLIADNQRKSYKIGKQAIVDNTNGSKILLYGTAYQIYNDGTVEKITKKNEILTSSPTKFFKLDDRKYLFVDSSISSSDKSITTSGYLIIELDKQGNATLANNNINVKTINPIILKGSVFDFDIANEKLVYNNNDIDLKNIIGSTNLFETFNADNEKKVQEQEEKEQENYYDEYLKNVVDSYNNLYNSVSNINDEVSQTVKEGEIYYEFSKWAALKSVSSSVNYIDISYVIFDPNNEYQSINVYITDEKDYNRKIELDKKSTEYRIMDLDIDTKYTLSFGYRLENSEIDIYNDVVNIATLLPEFNLSIKKLTNDKLYYNIKVENNYKITSGIVSLYVDGKKIKWNLINSETSIKDSGEDSYFDISNLTWRTIEIKLEDLCYSENNGICIKKINISKADQIINE